MRPIILECLAARFQMEADVRPIATGLSADTPAPEAYVFIHAECSSLHTCSQAIFEPTQSCPAASPRFSSVECILVAENSWSRSLNSVERLIILITAHARAV